MEIKSITDLINVLKKIGSPQKDHTRFFRGHSNQEYELKPSIYRNNGFIKNENKIIRDAIINNPDSFSKNDSVFNVLSKLQHYGYPTRLLDLTSNALVALYFIVNNNNNNGELIILDIPNENIKYFDSDTVSIVSSISLRNYNFNIELYKIIEEINFKKEKAMKIIKNNHEILKNKSSYKKITHELTSIENEISLIDKNLIILPGLFYNINKSEKLISKLKEELEMDVIEESQINKFAYQKANKIFNNQLGILELLHDIRKEKPGFSPIIKSDDLERVICVLAKLDNSRIIRQQGCFLLFGINNKKENHAILNEKWKKNDYKIIIPQQSKRDILNELKTFGISKKTLFPELESQSDEIKDEYKE